MRMEKSQANDKQEMCLAKVTLINSSYSSLNFMEMEMVCVDVHFSCSTIGDYGFSDGYARYLGHLSRKA